MGLEPLSFRIGLLGGTPRLARALSTATSIGGWDGGPPGSGMGISCHAAFGSYIATLVVLALFSRRVRPPKAVGQAYEAGSPV